jgi:hypothetical protein
MSSSGEAKETINVVNNFNFSRKVQNQRHHQWRQTNINQYQCSQHFLLFRVQNQCRHQWRQNQLSDHIDS